MVEMKLYRPRATYNKKREVYLVGIWYENKKTAQSYLDEAMREKEYSKGFLDMKTKRQVLKKSPNARIHYKPKILK